MRFLFVYQDYAQKARKLVETLAVDDVSVIVVRKKEDYPSPEELALIGNGQPPAALCQVVRRYRRNIRDLVDIQFETSTFREEDRALRDWLRPTQGESPPIRCPSEAFSEALLDCDNFILATNALANADSIHERRWPFVNDACRLLRRHAQGESLGPFREWEAKYGVEFAANGRVTYRCVLPNRQHSKASAWHLKDGDNTSADDAARIYFDVLNISGTERVIVFYAGPHPADGPYTAIVDF